MNLERGEEKDDGSDIYKLFDEFVVKIENQLQEMNIQSTTREDYILKMFNSMTVSSTDFQEFFNSCSPNQQTALIDIKIDIMRLFFKYIGIEETSSSILGFDDIYSMYYVFLLKFGDFLHLISKTYLNNKEKMSKEDFINDFIELFSESSIEETLIKSFDIAREVYYEEVTGFIESGQITIDYEQLSRFITKSLESPGSLQILNAVYSNKFNEGEINAE